MKLANTGLSYLHKIVIALSMIGALAIFDYQSFMGRTRQVELYDDLIGRLSSVRVSIDKLEYLIDMVIVAKNIEGVTVDVIKNDMVRLDRTVTELTDNPEYKDILNSNAILLEGIATIVNDWQPIKGEIGRLSPAMDQEEVLLMHSAVDMNSILLSEKTNSMVAVIAENRKAVFEDMKMLALKSVIGFFVIALAGLAAFQVKAFSPVQEAADTARRISSGNFMARFRNERAGLLSKLSIELNRALDYVNGMLAAMDRANASLASSLRTSVSQIEAMGSVLGFAGRTLSKNEMLQMALKEAVAVGGAGAAAVYLTDGGVFRLKSSAGLGECFIRDWSEIGADFPGAGSGGRAVAYRGLDGSTGQGYDRALRECGFKAIETVPLTFNDVLIGYLCLLFREEAQGPRSENAPFFVALASGVSVLLGHFDLYNEERLSKIFLDRVLNQIPAAFAVFDLSGKCVVINGALKRLLGADHRLVLAGEYNVFEDEAIRAGGFTEQIKKTCEGYSTELAFNFNPHEVKKHNFFKGPSRRLRIRTYPLYDEGGEVCNILLIYEELQDRGNAPAGEASKW